MGVLLLLDKGAKEADNYDRWQTRSRICGSGRNAGQEGGRVTGHRPTFGDEAVEPESKNLHSVRHTWRG